ncbi:hypothetical protein ACFE04_007763 [Oxalis oulophora]
MGDEYESESTTTTTTNNGFSDDRPKITTTHHRSDTLYAVIRRMLTEIFFPDSPKPFLQRIKTSVGDHAPALRKASKTTANDILIWTRRGSAFRALFVISVGTIMSLALTGLLVFFTFFVAATVNAIVISLLLSLAAAGGFLALFFASLTAIYIGALSVAVFVVSATTISAVIAVCVATGWIGFFMMIWLATKKSVGLAKHSVTMTGSALSAYSTARHAHHHPQPEKSD